MGRLSVHRLSDRNERARRGWSAPSIEVLTSAERFEMRVVLDTDGLPGLSGDGAWRVGVSAVIEETNGRKSYWALTHPPGKADFHHVDGFALVLPRSEPE